MSQISAIILAGGKSSRMGTDKGLIDINGKAMVQWVLDLVKEFTDDIYIISANPNYNQFNYPLVSDVFPNAGPLGGIYSGLLKIKNKKALILSCDTPFIEVKTIENLIENSLDFDITYAIENNKPHPLIGIYNQNCLPHLKNCIQNQKLKMTLAFEDLKTNPISFQPINPKEFLNINSKEDLII